MLFDGFFFAAYDAYVAFHHLMGRTAVDAAITNLELIKSLCQEFDERDAIRPATFAHFRQNLGNCAAAGEPSSSLSENGETGVGSAAAAAANTAAAPVGASGNLIGSSGQTALPLTRSVQS